MPGTEREWIFPDMVSADEVTRVIDACPSGALSYTRKDGGPEEYLPKVNTVRLWENGPLEFKADIGIAGHPQWAIGHYADKIWIIAGRGQPGNRRRFGAAHRHTKKGRPR